jgi:hypothetical protein
VAHQFDAEDNQLVLEQMGQSLGAAPVLRVGLRVSDMIDSPTAQGSRELEGLRIVNPFYRR